MGELTIERKVELGRKHLEQHPEWEGLVSAAGKWHDAAVKHSRIAIWCAAMCGSELNRMYEEFEHGEWMKFLRCLPFSDDTARRYRQLADEWSVELKCSPLDFIGKDSAAKGYLQIPHACGISKARPGKTAGSMVIDLPADAIREISEKVQNAVGNKTLTQLYFDWGICTPPKKHGGARDGAGRPQSPTCDVENGETPKMFDARMTAVWDKRWRKCTREVAFLAGDEKGLQYLPGERLEEIALLLAGATVCVRRAMGVELEWQVKQGPKV